MIDFAQLVEEERVHRDLFVRPDIYDAEMDRIFSTVWVYVAHESEIPNPGDFKLTQIGAEPVIVTRTVNGTINVLLNRCAHRGLTVCQKRSGNASTFRCAYHSWSYDGDGKLIGVPYPKGYGDNFDRDAYSLGGPSRVESYRGFVFASFNPAVMPLPAWLGPAAEYIDSFIESSPVAAIKARSGTYRYHFDGNWKLQLDGSIDGYHPYLLHKSFFDAQDSHSGRRSNIYNREDTLASCVDLGNGHAALDSREEFRRSNVFYERVRMAPGGQAVIAELEKDRTPDETREIIGRTVGNGFNLLVFPNLSIIQTQIRVIFPAGVRKTRVEVTPTTLEGVPQALNRMRLRSHELFFGPAGFGSPDDLEAFNRTQAGLEAAHSEWLDLSRGRDREQPRADRVFGHVSDETHQRGIYRQWRALMTADERALAGVPA
jgi:phenylpropionate dioxygenase-like ring-hydroxylating dioxygenase large terminal subunit